MGFRLVGEHEYSKEGYGKPGKMWGGSNRRFLRSEYKRNEMHLLEEAKNDILDLEQKNCKNLINNIGFDIGATHTFEKKLNHVKTSLRRLRNLPLPKRSD